MASPSKETSSPGQPIQPSVYSALYRDLQNDYKSVLNQAVWNAGLLYPFYAFDLDEKIFKRNEGNLTMALKIAGLCAGVTEAQKLVRKVGMGLGLSPRIIYPFGVSNH